MITEKLAEIMGWKVGHGLWDGHQIKCAGTPDADGNPHDRHLICTLDDPLPGAQNHAVGNIEFTDDLWIIEPNQSGIDWSNPVCQICQKEIAP